jgi:hypothetical protein
VNNLGQLYKKSEERFPEEMQTLMTKDPFNPIKCVGSVLPYTAIF